MNESKKNTIEIYQNLCDWFCFSSESFKIEKGLLIKQT